MPTNKPKLSAAASKIRDQINKTYTSRDKATDGWIGDVRHQKTKSDHNPDPKTGVVRALDIDADLGKGIDSWDLAEAIRQAAKAGDKRLSYIIHNKKIASATLGWVWRPYSGSNPHISHIHLSFKPLGDEDRKTFKIDWPKAKTVTTPPARNQNQVAELEAIKAEQKALAIRIGKLEAKIK